MNIGFAEVGSEHSLGPGCRNIGLRSGSEFVWSIVAYMQWFLEC